MERIETWRRIARIASIVLPLVAIIVLLSACTFTGEGMTIEYKSPENKEIWNVYWLVWWLAVAVFASVEAALFFCIFRFRRRPGRGLPRQLHGNNRLEIAWTIVPALLLILIAVPTIDVIIKQATHAPPGADVVRVHVYAHQFWWEFRYPDPSDPNNPDKDLVTANEMHVPVGKTIEFQLTSQDVQHSFWVAKLGGKMDIYPNRTNFLKFTPEETGKYFGQCAELCGTGHGFMKFYVFVDEPAAYQQWLSDQRAAAVAAQGDIVKKGQSLVTGGACAGCHYIEGTSAKGRIGPNLTHIGSRTTFVSGWAELNEQNLKIWIHNPAAIKPGVTDQADRATELFAEGIHFSRMPAFPQYTDEELTAIARYLLSLK